MPIQAIYGLETDGWTSKKLRIWMKQHKLKPIKRLHKKGNELRYRIRDPTLYSKYSTQVLPEGIHLVIGWT